MNTAVSNDVDYNEIRKYKEIHPSSISPNPKQENEFEHIWIGNDWPYIKQYFENIELIDNIKDEYNSIQYYIIENIKEIRLCRKTTKTNNT